MACKVRPRATCGQSRLVLADQDQVGVISGFGDEVEFEPPPAEPRSPPPLPGGPLSPIVLKLIDDFPLDAVKQSLLVELRPSAKALDKLYIPTRYPNGLPDLSPFEVYTLEEAHTAIDAARRVLDACAVGSR